jgi:hypothetical protein
MGYKEVQLKLNAIKNRLNELHQPPKKIADENYEYYGRQLALYKDLVGPEMDEAEMFYVVGILFNRRFPEYSLRCSNPF